MNKGDPSGSGASPDKPPRQGRSDGRAEVRPVDSTRRTGEPFTGGSGWRQMTRSGATRAPCKGSDSPLCKERMKLTVETNLERIAAKCCESSVEERGAGKLHATFCGNRGRAIAPGDPVLGVKLPGPTRQRWRKSSRKYLEQVCVGETNESEPFEDAPLARGSSSKPGVTPSPGTSLPEA